jgi:hypothetical protein
MPHRRLCRPQRDARLAQQRAERSPQGVHVERPPTVIVLRDAGGFLVRLSHLCGLLDRVEQGFYEFFVSPPGKAE